MTADRRPPRGLAPRRGEGRSHPAREDRAEDRGAEHATELVGRRLQAARDPGALDWGVADDRLRRGDDRHRAAELVQRTLALMLEVR